MPKKTLLSAFLLCLLPAASATAQTYAPPFDIWTDEVMTKIRDKSTLNYTLDSRFGYSEITYTSDPAANYFDGKAPFAEHTGDKITIHGYFAFQSLPGNNPAIVVLHDRGGQADLNFAQLLSSLGLVVLVIDAPQAGRSTGGPIDTMQSWISIDKGAQYSYLYHYAVAAMRGLTLLEAMAELPDNPFKIDATRLGVMGIGSGGIVASMMNAIDARIDGVLLVGSGGSQQRSLRIPNSWLYHDIYTGTRDLPYNGADPQNSIEDIEFDSTAIDFFNYFDPIRYAPRQYGSVLALSGTHDQYFPLSNANLSHLAVASGGATFLFQKRLWLMPNQTHSFFSSATLGSLSGAIKQWFDFCFLRRAFLPLSTPQIALTEVADGLRFDISLNETATRLAGATVNFYAATAVDSTPATISDFKTYFALRDANRYIVTLPAGERSGSGTVYSASNIIFFVTITDSTGLPVSSLVYKGRAPIDLSSDFTPVIDRFPSDPAVVPTPPAPADLARTAASSVTLPADSSYQGMSLSNPTDAPMAVRVEARSTDGKMATLDGLLNPSFLTVPPHAQRIFVQEQWFGRGARQLNGSYQVVWNNTRATSLAFRGNDFPSVLDANGPLVAPAKSLWLLLVPEQDSTIARKLRFFSGSSSAATVSITYRGRLGDLIERGQFIVPAWGMVEIEVNVGSGTTATYTAQIESTAPISARMEVRPSRDSWSIEAVPVSPATLFVQPHAEFNGQYKTRFAIVNTSTDRKIVKWRRYRADGRGQIGNEITLTLEKYYSATIQLESLFQVPGAEVKGGGWVAAEVEGGGLVIQALATDPATLAVAASPVGGMVKGTLSMPFFVENTAYWTGLAIANPEAAAMTGTIIAYDMDGKMLGQAPIALAAGERKTMLVTEWVSGITTESRGQIVITSPTPISLLAYFGTDNGFSLAAIPFTLIVP